MSGLCRIVALSALVGLPHVAAGAGQDAHVLQVAAAAVSNTGSFTSGWIEGIVTDDHSRPIVGAAVTAQGRELLVVQTNGTGQFSFRSVPAGTYLLRVQGRGYGASKREFVQVMPSRGTRHLVRLHRATEATLRATPPALVTAGASLGRASAEQLPERPVPDAKAPGATAASQDDHAHSEILWWLRHGKRSALRDTSGHILVEDLEPVEARGWTRRAFSDPLGSTFDLGLSAAAALTRSNLSGRVQLLTASAFDDALGAMTYGEMPAGIAYVSVGAPVSTRTAWSVEAAMTRGEVSSWFVAGTYATTLMDTHGLDVGSSFSRQRYDGGNPAAVAEFAGGSRNVGGFHVHDRWTVTPRVMITYGGAYEHYDYLDRPALFSPSVAVSVSPADRTWIRTSVSQQMSAPGAEEFVPQQLGSLTLPPQRTFSPLVPGTRLGRERTRHLDVTLERQVASFVLSLSHFVQSVDDQMVTLFGSSTGAVTQGDLSHYTVARGGSFSASGWRVGVSRPLGSRVRGTLSYQAADANWLQPGEDELEQWTSTAATRYRTDRVHDITTRLDAEIRETHTRFLGTYRFNLAVSRDGPQPLGSHEARRFDVQVHQGLPFLGFSRTRWELLLSVRNLFRDAQNLHASVYDEILVVRSPKRVVGGVTVQF